MMIVLNALAVLAYLGSSWYLWRRFPACRVFLGYLTFLNGWALLSCFYNDLGIYNIELFRHTFSSYATSRLALFCIVFNLGVFAMAWLVGDRQLTRRDYSLKLSGLSWGRLRLSGYAAVLLVIVYIAYALVHGGIPLLSGLGRHAYMQQAGVVERAVIVYGPLIAFLCGYFRRDGKRFSGSMLIMVTLLAFAVLVGNKFSYIIILAVCYYLPVYVKRISGSAARRPFSMKRGLLYVGLVCLMLGWVFSTYVRSHGDRTLAYEYMYNRILAFQGEMWWAVDQDIQDQGRYDNDHWKAELSRVLTPGNRENKEVGLRYLMIKVLGPERAYAIIDRGYLYTGTYPAILIATFPYWLALAIQLPAGLFFFLILYYLHFCVLYRHLLRAAIASLILVPYTVTLIVGSLGTILTLGLIVKVGLLALLESGLIPQNGLARKLPTDGETDR